MATNDGIKMMDESINETQYKSIKKDCIVNGIKNTCTGANL